ncbi:MAG: hypothetical protein ACXWED_03770 [Solirubrobacterales bacterium]
MGRGTKIVIAAAAGLALLAPAASAADNDALITYSGPVKLKVQKRIAYPVVCSANCQVTATTTLLLPGPDLGPVVVPGSLTAGASAEPFVVLNKAALRNVRNNVGRARLRTQIDATNVTTGDTDTDTRVFRFHR